MSGGEIEEQQNEEGIRQIEFFSGIGGMRYGVQRALDAHNDSSSKRNGPKISLQSCKAYEISLHANKTYAHNFKHVMDKTSKPNATTKESFTVHTKLIEQIKPSDVDGVADLWTMSPPCQPFTRTIGSKQRDSDDERCKGFKAILQLLKAIDKKPRWIIVENVKNFVGSQMLSLWKECLMECGYTFEEYLLSPTQFLIPNHRTRYYMICERSNRFQCNSLSPDNLVLSSLSWYARVSDASHHRTREKVEEENIYQPYPISEYLKKDDLTSEEERKILMIPDNVFEKKWAKDLPVVTPFDRQTHCFTAFYGRKIHRATGSLLLMDPKRIKSLADVPLDRSDMSKYKGQLRRFSPKELLRIFGFPNEFVFPDDISLEHQYKLIGNSVNVSVVSFLVLHLLGEV